MPLTLPDKLPAIELLKNENIFVMNSTRADLQDIRPLRWDSQQQAAGAHQGRHYMWRVWVHLRIQDGTSGRNGSAVRLSLHRLHEQCR